MTNRNNHYKKVWTATLLTLLALTLSTSAISVVKATDMTRVFIDYYGEPVIIDSNLVPGTQFTVNISLNEVEDLWSFQFELGEAGIIPGWDPTVLQLIDFGIPGYVPGQPGGGFLGSKGGTIKWYPGTADNTEGYLTLSVGALDPKTKLPSKPPAEEGVLAFLIFEVVSIGSSPIHFGLDSALLNRTGGFDLGPYWQPCRGTLNPDFLTDGYFDNRPLSANLVRKSAWPEHHHYSISKDEDAYQNLTGKARNLGTIGGVYVKVNFTITKEGGSTISHETSVEYIAWPGQILDIQYMFGPLDSPGDEGKYTVTARCWYSGDGIHAWTPGEKIKSFTFTIVS